MQLCQCQWFDQVKRNKCVDNKFFCIVDIVIFLIMTFTLLSYMVEFFASGEIGEVRVWKKDNEEIYKDDRHYDDTQYAEKEFSIIQLVK